MADILETFDQKLYVTTGHNFDGVLLSHKQEPYQYLKVERFYDEQDYMGINWSTTMGATVIEPLLGEYFGSSYRISPIELGDRVLQIPQDRAEANKALRATIRFDVDGGEQDVDEGINYFVWRINNDQVHQVGALVMGTVIPDAIHTIMQKTITTPSNNHVEPLLQKAAYVLRLN